MITLAKAVKNIVSQSVDYDFLGNEVLTLKQVYEAEYGYNGVSAKACKNYLQGLPSVCTIPFNNHEILELLAEQGIERKTEGGQYRLIEQYWNEAGYQFYKLIKI